VTDEAHLTAAEQRVIAMMGEVWDLLVREVVTHGPTRDEDLRELIAPVHLIQRYVGSQAAARAYPTQFRALGETL
jgi:hypothetical protein